MQRQQQELDNFRHWLTVTEDRISRMARIGPTHSDLVRQIEQHPNLQADLQKQEAITEALSHMVVVVDDPDSGKKIQILCWIYFFFLLCSEVYCCCMICFDIFRCFSHGRPACSFKRTLGSHL